MSRTPSSVTGILLVDKPGLPTHQTGPVHPRGLPTSHDIVQQVRRWSGQRRIGHTGTLDPMASGLLALCLGQATRMVEYYQGHDKVYWAEISLGRTTDTYDAVGQTVAEAPVPQIALPDLEEALAPFLGPIQQRPPAFSALKQGGESLHRKARRGEVVDLPPRPVTIHSLSLLDWQPPQTLTLRISCSAGTYIRSLAQDLGQHLGCGAHLSALRREEAGLFTLAQALTPDQAKRAFEADPTGSFLLPMEFGLDLPRQVVAEAELVRLGHGQQVALPFSPQQFPVDSLVMAMNDQAQFCGVIRCLHVSPDSPSHTIWKAQKWLT